MSEVVRRIVAALAQASGTLTTFDRTGHEVTLSYRDLSKAVAVRARELRASGLQAGDYVALMMRSDLAAMRDFLAVCHLGATPFSLKPSSDEDANRAVASDLSQRHGLNWALDVPGVADRRDPRPLSDTRRPSCGLAFVQFTSGTTRNPKPVPVTDRMLEANLRVMQTYNSFTPDRVAMNFLPLSHDFGLVAAFLLSLLEQHPLIVLEPQLYYANPTRYLGLIPRFAVTSVAHTTSSLRYLNRALARRASSFDLRSLDNLTLGAEPIDPQVVRETAARLAPCGLEEAAFSFGYGMAEAVLFATGHRVARLCDAFVDHPEVPGLSVARLGKGGFGVDVDIDNGAIRVRGESVFDGYLGAAKRDDPWFCTQDRAAWAGGEVVMLGRLDDCVFDNGRNIYLNDVEAVLGKALPDDQLYCVGVDQVVVLVVRPPGAALSPELTAAVQSEMAKRFGLKAAAIMPVTRKRVAFSASGKLRRAETLQRISVQ